MTATVQFLKITTIRTIVFFVELLGTVSDCDTLYWKVLNSFTANDIVLAGSERGAVFGLDAEETKYTSKQIHNTESRLMFNFQPHENAIFDVALNYDDMQMAFASGDRTGSVWDITTRERLGVFTGHEGSVKQIKFDPHGDGHCLATSSRDGSIAIWDLRCAPHTTCCRARKPVIHITSAHQKADSGPKNKRFAKQSRASLAAVPALVYLPNHPYQIVSGGEDNSVVKLWDLRNTSGSSPSSRKPVNESPLTYPKNPTDFPRRHFGITSLQVSPDGNDVFALTRGREILVHRTSHLNVGAIRKLAWTSLEVGSFYVRMSLSPDGQLLAVGSDHGMPSIFKPNAHVDIVSALSSGDVSEDIVQVKYVDSMTNGDVKIVAWTRHGTLAILNDCTSLRLLSAI